MGLHMKDVEKTVFLSYRRTNAAWALLMHKELTDLDETAEALERGLATVNESILGLQTLLKKLPGI